MPLSVIRLSRYPVKGLSSDRLEAVDLTPGLGLPGDRRFALALESTRFERDSPEWLPKTSFLMLARHEKLAALETRYDEAAEILTILRRGRKVVSGRLTDPVGRAMIEDFFSAYMGRSIAGKPRLVEGPPGHMFSDHRNKVVSLINLASVRELERLAGRPLDADRFRGNVLFDGGGPWEEFTWVGRDFQAGGVRLRIAKRIERCPATSVNPLTGERDVNVPLLLRQTYDHADFGVYAEVMEAGRLAVGDVLLPV
ncbi:MAG: MOSC domain-containing protein [Magnetospirillum sp. WYHS-4]